jgi:2-keto-3-deoxy-L-rhamnonate aldolase RhmA
MFWLVHSKLCHQIKNIERYNNEAMVPPNSGNAWLPKTLITIGKETLDLVPLYYMIY